jgi:hypothetical protein
MLLEIASLGLTAVLPPFLVADCAAAPSPEACDPQPLTSAAAASMSSRARAGLRVTVYTM